MRALMVSAATAVVGGLLMGAAIRPTESDLHEQPVGPQIISDGAWEGDTAVVASISRRVGPLPDYVIGTDWAHPKSYETPIAAVYELPDTSDLYEAEAYATPAVYAAPPAPAATSDAAIAPQPRAEPRRVSYPSIDGDIVGPALAASALGSDAVERLEDGGAERVEVIRVDRQGGGQIDNLAHGADPHALVGEPAA